MRTQRKKYSRLWVYLLYLGLVTSLILSVTLAKYASTAGGTGTAAVAAVAGGASVLQPEPIEMPLEGLFPGETRELKFQVVNFTAQAVSEVAMDYDVTVETTGNLPLRFKLSSDAGENAAAAPAGEAALPLGQPLTGGFFPLGEDGTDREQTHTYTLTAEWPEGESNVDYADEIDLVTVTVTARQRLGGG